MASGCIHTVSMKSDLNARMLKVKGVHDCFLPHTSQPAIDINSTMAVAIDVAL
jgi:hypothetical protein